MRPRTFVTALLCAVLLPTAGLLAAPDHNVELTPGQEFTWDGTMTAGVNPNFHPWAPDASAVFPVEDCSKNPHWYCDTLLVKFSNPLTQAEIDALIAAGQPVRKRKTATVNIGNYTTPASDYDLRVFASDANGTKGAMIAETGELNGSPETASLTITTTPEAPDQWVLVHVGYWAAAGTYDGSVKF